MEETIKFIIEDISIILAAIVLIITINKSLKIYQDTHYQLKKTLALVWHFYHQYYLYFVMIPFIFLKALWYIELINIAYLGYLLYLLLRKHEIARLKFTPRIIRQYIFMMLLYPIVGTLLFIYLPFNSLLSVLDLLLILSPLLVVACGGIMLPVEKLISLYYLNKAKKKLNKYNPQVVGITGSCGKTSVKNYLFEMVKHDYMVYMSPKSYNTINGLSMTINEYLTHPEALLLLEMGATKKNDIKALVDYTKPKYGIITEIAPQHLSTFKTIETIVSEKFKLIESLPIDGVGFLNYDNPYIRAYPVKTKARIVTYGTSSDCDIYATNIKMTFDGLIFTVNYINGAFDVKSKLVGKHNVNNLLGAIACSLELKTPVQDIIDAISLIKPVKHRLEIRHEGDLIIIDDAYNSNPLGFKNALAVLNLAQDKKTLITPGIVEAGDATKDINYKLAQEIVKVCDQVILVKNVSADFIYQGLRDAGYQNVVIVSTFHEGFKMVKEGTVLIENDLPDNYFL